MSSSAPAGTKRRHKPADVRRDEILAAAATVFAARGYRLADVNEVAQQAGAGKGTVYRYFPTKQALFSATLKRNLNRLSATVEEARTAHSDTLDSLRAAVRAYFEFFDRHPETIELFVQERAELQETPKPLYFMYSEAYRDDWLGLFQSLSNHGCGLAVSAEKAMELLGSLLYGTVVSNRLAGIENPQAPHSDALVDTYLYGIFHDKQQFSR